MSPTDALFDENDLLRSFEKITAIDYHQEIECEGVRFTCYHAGHVLGAAMFMVDIGGTRILYTGDYSREEDRHLMSAEIPPGSPPDVMICESTYGVQSHEPRSEREKRFTTRIHEIVQRGGRCLLPVFALGKAQELLLILDEYWQAHPELHSIPIYYASSLAKKCLAIYQTYLHMMHPSLRRQNDSSSFNPFVFKFVTNVKSMDTFDDTGPCVMMASPGMLQSGLSRELLEAWCTDKRNGLVLTGYSVEGTMAKHLLNEPSEIASSGGGKLSMRMSVEYISFSAHVDFVENAQFIDMIKPRHLVLVHGEYNEMHRLKNALNHKYDERREHIEDAEEEKGSAGRPRVHIYTPRNCEAVELLFSDDRHVKEII